MILFPTHKRLAKKLNVDENLFNTNRLEDLVTLERTVLQFWDRLKLHQKLMEKNRGNKRFSFFDGPITANNPMGVHHAWGRTYKDVVQRYKAMCGYDQRFQNGFDTQGLWLEVEVEKELGLRSKKEIETFGLENFALACKKRVEKYSAVQTRQSKRLGQTMDWENSYFTHTDENISAIWHFLKVCHEKGWLYKGIKPMPWCWRCGTSLSNHEQADSYKVVVHKAPYVKFKLVGKEEYLLVWTTTPWTLTANQAVAVHPDLKYAVFLTPEGETLVSGLWLKNTLLKHCVVLAEVSGKDLEGLCYETPFANLEKQPKEERSVYLWNDVTDKEGTGLVHVAPGCGAEDYVLGQEKDLLPLSPLNEEGVFAEGYNHFSGLHYTKVNENVVKELENRGLLFHLENYKHKYPACWRCKEELVFRLVDEWFLSSKEVRSLMQKAAAQVNWQPAHVGKLFQDWLRNMGDWCVSRKRYWGLPLPFYECQCRHLTVVGSKKEFFDKAVGDVSQVTELHRPWVDKVQVRCDNCNMAVDRVTEVGDCWLDAGAMPFSTVEYFSDKQYWMNWFPADFVCEMREQTRLWFYATMFMAVTLEGKTPYRAVASYEKVQDMYGRPMHKSTGNTVWFDDAVEKLGADTMRLMYLAQNPVTPMKFNLDLGHEYGKPLMVLWNVLKFFTSIADLDNFKYLPLISSNSLDLWILSELDSLTNEFRSLLDSYNFRGLHQLLEIFLDNLSSWYVRRSRRRFWVDKWSEDKQCSMNTLYLVLLALSKLMAPLTPFMAEFVYQALRAYSLEPMEKSVHLCEYPQSSNQFHEKLRNEVKQLRELVSMGLRLRNSNRIRVRQPLNEMLVWSSDLEFPRFLATYSTELQDELNVKQVTVLENVQDYLEYSVKAKFDLLGPRLGRKVNKVVKELEKLSTQDVTNWLSDSKKGKLKLKHNLTLSRGEVEVRAKPKKGFDALSEGSTVVFLDTRLTPQLKEEGLLRDFVRHVQMARKEMKLPLDQKITLQLCVNEDLWEVFARNEEFVRKETQTQDLMKTLDFEETIDLLHIKYSFTNNGNEVHFSLTPLET